MKSTAIILWEEDYPTTLFAEQWLNTLALLEQFYRLYTLHRAQQLLRQALPLAFTDQIIPSPAERYQL